MRARMLGMGGFGVVLACALELGQADAQPPQQTPWPWGAPAAQAWINMSYEQLKPLLEQLPCPLPGLPPELAQLVDCGALKRLPSNPTPYQPVPPQPGGPPPFVDHRAQGLVGPIRDQGMVGSCEANAIAAVIDTYTRARRVSVPAASALHVFAIYERTRINGVDRDDLDNLMRVSGVTAETIWPYDPVKACRVALGPELSGCDQRYHVVAESGYSDPTLIAERQRADAAPSYRVLDIESITQRGQGGTPVDPDRAVTEIPKLVAGGEGALVILDMGSNWTSAGGAHGIDVLPPPQGYYGSHAVVVQGYRTAPSGQQFLIQNSWGTGWGQGGYAWIPVDAFRARLRAAYRLRLALTTDPPGGGSVPRPPAPPAQPGPASTCAPGTTPMFGMCVPALPPCAPGTAPTFAQPCVPR